MKIQINTVQQRQYTCDIEEECYPAALRLWDVFSRNSLGVALGKDMWVLNPKYIEKVTFHPESPAHWQSLDDLILLRVISPESCHIAVDALQSKRSGRREHAPRDVARGVMELTLASGNVNFLEFILKPRPKYEQEHSVWNLFSRSPYPIPCEGGGFVLYNAANICMASMSPALTGLQSADYRVWEPQAGLHSLDSALCAAAADREAEFGSRDSLHKIKAFSR